MRVFEALISEQKVLDDLCRPLMERLASSSGMLRKWSLNVARVPTSPSGPTSQRANWSICAARPPFMDAARCSRSPRNNDAVDGALKTQTVEFEYAGKTISYEGVADRRLSAQLGYSRPHV